MDKKGNKHSLSNLNFAPTRDDFITINTIFKDRNLPITHKKTSLILENEELYQLLKNNSLLIGISRPIINRTFNSLSNKTNLLFLTDNDGCIIDLIGSPDIVLSHFNIGIMIGSNMNHASFGTNAISMAILKKSPVSFLGHDHYCNVLKDTNCSVAPIRINKEIVGFAGALSLYTQDLVYLESLIITMADLIASYLNNSRYKENPTSYFNSIRDKEHTSKKYFYGSLMLNNKFNFTFREIEILYLIYMEHGYDIISSQLCISKNTFKTHLKNIYEKLAIRNLRDCLCQIDLLIEDNDYFEVNPEFGYSEPLL